MTRRHSAPNETEGQTGGPRGSGNVRTAREDRRDAPWQATAARPSTRCRCHSRRCDRPRESAGPPPRPPEAAARPAKPRARKRPAVEPATERWGRRPRPAVSRPGAPLASGSRRPRLPSSPIPDRRSCRLGAPERAQTSEAGGPGGVVSNSPSVIFGDERRRPNPIRAPRGPGASGSSALRSAISPR